MICACLVPARWVGGLAAGVFAACSRIAATVFTTTGSIPMASSPTSVTTSVVPCPSPVSRQGNTREIGLDRILAQGGVIVAAYGFIRRLRALNARLERFVPPQDRGSLGV